MSEQVETKKQTMKTLKDELNKARGALHRAVKSNDPAKMKQALKVADDALEAFAASVERAKARLSIDE